MDSEEEDEADQDSNGELQHISNPPLDPSRHTGLQWRLLTFSASLQRRTTTATTTQRRKDQTKITWTTTITDSQCG